MFNRKTLIDPTGNRFRVISKAQGKPPKGLKPLAFRTSADARRFLQRFNAPADYWRQLLTGLNLDTGHTYQKRDDLQRVAEYLTQGRLKLYGVPRPNAQTNLDDTSTATVKIGNGAWLQFTPAIKAMGPMSGRQQSYATKKQARTFLNSLNLSDEQLQAIAKQAELPTVSPAKTTDARLDQLAKALVDETVVLFRQTPYTKPPEAPIADPVASAPGNRPVDLAPPPLRTWVEIQLLDDQGNPVTGEAYWIICPEGQKHEGTTNGEGKARVDGILQGTCQVAFPNIEGSGIHQCAANVDCCTPAETDTDAANDEAAAVTTTDAKAATTSEPLAATEATAEPEAQPESIAAPITEPETETAWAEFQLEDSNGKPIADRDYILVDPDGNEHRGKTDANGSARVEDLTPGECEVRFLPLDTNTTPAPSSASAGSNTAVQAPAAQTEPANDAPAPTPAPAPAPAETPEEVPDNYVDVAYQYADGSGVGGARYSVVDTATGSEVASGTLPASGEIRVAIPVEVSNVEVFFFDDPEEVAIVKESKPEVTEDVPDGWFDRMTQGLQDGADWTWELLQGDFNENPSVGQIITNAIITMIPVVDQVADARDLVAAIKQLAWDKRYDEAGPWVSFFFTLIGLVPSVGSALKGVLKLVWKGAKLDAVLQIFNFFMKGNGVKWLKELRAGNLAEYAKQAARIGHDVLDVVIDQLKTLKSKLPQWFDDTHAQIQDILNSLQAVKNRINGQFESIAKQMNEKLGKVLSDAGEKIGIPGSAKGKVVKTQASAEPPQEEAHTVTLNGASKTNPKDIRSEAESWPPIKKARFSAADEFYAEVGYKDFDNHLRGIDFEQPVEVITIKKGEKLYQYSYLDRKTGRPKVGSYYYQGNDVDIEKLGFEVGNRKMIEVEVLEDVEVLKSQAADIEDWNGSDKIFSGGETQLFNPSIKTSTPIIVK